jgi:hypothetical protein
MVFFHSYITSTQSLSRRGELRAQALPARESYRSRPALEWRRVGCRNAPLAVSFLAPGRKCHQARVEASGSDLPLSSRKNRAPWRAVGERSGALPCHSRGGSAAGEPCGSAPLETADFLTWREAGHGQGERRCGRAAIARQRSLPGHGSEPRESSRKRLRPWSSASSVQLVLRFSG